MVADLLCNRIEIDAVSFSSKKTFHHRDFTARHEKMGIFWYLGHFGTGKLRHCTEVRFASFLSGGFTNMAVINPPERKVAKRTSVHFVDVFYEQPQI